MGRLLESVQVRCERGQWSTSGVLVSMQLGRRMFPQRAMRQNDGITNDGNLYSACFYCFGP